MTEQKVTPANFNYAKQFNAKDIETFKAEFASFDVNSGLFYHHDFITLSDGHIDPNELSTCLKNLGEFKDLEQVSALVEEVDVDGNGMIEFNEFCYIIFAVRSGYKKSDSGFAKVYQQQRELIQVKGAVGQHTFAQEEMTAFAEHLNNTLKNDPDVAHLLPIDASGTQLCTKISDGILLCKFINLAVRDTIDTRVINKPKAGKSLTLFQITENLNLAISSAKSIGVSTVNLGSTELADGLKYPHLVLGLIWQLVKIQLLNCINLKNHPELFRLLQDGETLQDLLRLPPEQLLLRWFNYHLKQANWPRRVNNFSGDVKDGENYTVLLNQIAPQQCNRQALQESDKIKKGEMIINNAKKLDVPVMIQAQDIANGNAHLNLAFTAAIFNTRPGLDPPTDEEKMALVGLMEDDIGDSREERAFRMWINSLGLPDIYINSLFEDCKDGLVLLRILDHIQPGIVAWSKVEKKAPLNKFKQVSNCNYAVLLGKQMKFSLVGIGGSDINEGNKKLTLALVWQMMRLHTLSFLSHLKLGGQSVNDAMIIKWANDKVAASGKKTKMSSFKDDSLKNGLFLIDLLASVENRIINWDLVTPGITEGDSLLNAKYAISLARKLGAVIFLLPEDIVEVKPKMIMTFVAAIMTVAK